MKQKISWEQMKKQYPKQWLLITGFELDEYGQILKGIVRRHSEDKDQAANPPILDEDTAFRYTGESTFAGLRSHATHHHTL